MNPANIRNIAIIAHVDHGKTTLVDQLLRQSGSFRENQQIEERAMDSMDLEREKGITIRAKNTSVHWHDKLINIVDTPGHADFGAEVERVMKMVDGVLLLIDAADGPQAQTRFVLRKAMAAHLHPIIVINKVDREHARPEWALNETLELLLELGATEDQFDAPVIFASARDGWADLTIDGPRTDMQVIFKTIVDIIPPPRTEEGPFRMLVSNVDWNDFVGRVAVGRVLSGKVAAGEWLHLMRADGSGVERMKVTKIFEYSGLRTNDSEAGVAGNIIGLSGFANVSIGDTLAFDPKAERLPFVEIDPPTIQMEFAVNDGPLAGRDGKLVTSRQIRDRLVREMQSNISIKMEDQTEGTRFKVNARGAMQISILVEQMRREGFEVLVSRPTVIEKVIDGQRCEPFETAWIEVPETELGGVMEILARRRGVVQNIEHHAHGVTVETLIPTRGLIGFEFDLVNLTSGRGVMNHLFESYRPVCGEIVSRQSGTLVSIEQGKVMAYALDALQDRGRLFVAPGDEVYEGMIVGENPRRHDMPVNPTKAKHLVNFRSSGDGKGIQLSPPMKFSLERAIEYIEPDEYVEATPNFIRLRKRVLDSNQRRKLEKARAGQ